MRIDQRLAFASGAVGLVLAAPAFAHHSAAMFDRTVTVNLVGTVKEVQWTNPHAWMEVLAAPEGAGEVKEWGVEFQTGPQNLIQLGLTRDNPKPGDKCTIAVHPLRDGRPAGSFVSLTLADGRTLADRLRPLPAPAAAP